MFLIEYRMIIAGYIVVESDMPYKAQWILKKVFNIMNIIKFKEAAKKNKGIEMTAKEFKYAFKLGMKELNILVTEGVLKIVGKTNYNNDNIYEVVQMVKYSDGKDHSSLVHNGNDNDYECVNCGEEQDLTVTDDADICHACGEVYR